VNSPSRATAKHYWSLAAVFGFALALRLIYLSQIHHAPPFTVLVVDAHEYDRWAQEIAAGDWLGKEAFYQAPLYPYFLALNYVAFGHDLLAVRVVQVVLGSLACVLLAAAGVRFFSFRVGIAAGLLLAAYPMAIFFDTIIQKSVLDLLLMTLVLWLLALLSQTPSMQGWFLIGVALGLFALTRENALVLLPVIGVWLWIHFRGESSRRRLQWSLLLVGGLALVLFPVGLRNRLVGGEFYITSSHFGPNLYIGNHEGANGQFIPLRWGRSTPELERHDATELAELALGHKATPHEVSRYWTDRVIDYIRREPGAWLKLMGRKWFLTWNAAEMVDAEGVDTYREYSSLLHLLSRIFHFGVLCPFAAVGIAASWRRRDQLWILYLIVLSMAVSVSLFYVFARYRFPMVPVLILFAAAAIVEGLRMVQGRNWLGLATGGVLAALVAVVVNIPLIPAAIARATTEYNLGYVLQGQGKTAEAEQHFEKALRLNPDFIPAHFNLALILTTVRNFPGAIAHYEAVLRLRPDYAEAHSNLAGVLLQIGKPEEAIAHYENALELNPNQEMVHYNLAVVLTQQDKLDQAVSHYAEALRLMPDYVEAHVNLAAVLDRLNRGQEATLHYREALRIRPDSFLAHLNFGMSLAKQGELTDAIGHYRQALRLRPASPDAHYFLASALEQQSLLDEAEKEYREAVRLRPDFALARQALEALLVRRDNARATP